MNTSFPLLPKRSLKYTVCKITAKGLTVIL